MPFTPYLLFPNGRKLFLSAEGLQYTRTLGMSPNFNTMVAPNAVESFDPPGGPLPAVDDLVTLFLVDPTTGEQIILPFETIHEVDLIEDVSGRSDIRIVLKDPRYVLHQGAITGHYNVPHEAPAYRTRAHDQNGNPIEPIQPIRPKDQTEIEQSTLEKLQFPMTLRGLIDLCLKALGLDPEDDYDLSMLKIREASQIPSPNPDGLQIGDDLPLYPAVKWEFANPAREAERLLNEHGFAVTLWTPGVNGDASSPIGQSTGGNLSNKLVVVKLGQWHPQQRTGFEPPAPTFYDQASLRKTSTGIAQHTVVVGGRTVIEEFTELEPVGLDVDGQIKPLAELSYAVDVTPQSPYGRFDRVSSPSGFKDYDRDPVNGVMSPPSPMQGQAAFTFDEVKAVAEQSIWKWFRLPKSHLWKLPVLGQLVSTRKIEGRVVRKEPYVDLEMWQAEIASGRLGANVAVEDLSDRYQIDLALGLVKFSSMMLAIRSVQHGEDETRLAHRPAKVVLHWTHESVQLDAPLVDDAPNPNPATWKGKVTEADFYRYPAGAPLDRANIIQRQELVLYRKATTPNTVTGSYEDQNRAELDLYAIKLIGEARFSDDAYIAAPSGNVPGLIKFSVDGFMRQVTWSIRNNQSDTTLSANRERPVGGRQIEPYEEGLFKRETTRVVKAAREGTLLVPQASPSGRTATAATPTRNSTPEAPQETASRPGLVSVLNVTDSHIPAFSFVQVVGGDTSLGLLHVKRPSQSEPNFGYYVTQAPLPAGSSGYAGHSGSSYVRIAAGADITAGDYIEPGVDRVNEEELPGLDPEEHRGPFVGYLGSLFRVLKVYANPPGGPSDDRLPDHDHPVALIQLTATREFGQFGKIVDRGPAYPGPGGAPTQDPDFTDKRYWVDLGFVKPQPGWTEQSPLDVEAFPPTDEANHRIITATNIADSSSQAHDLPTDGTQDVFVRLAYDRPSSAGQTPRPYFWFSIGVATTIALIGGTTSSHGFEFGMGYARVAGTRWELPIDIDMPQIQNSNLSLRDRFMLGGMEYVVGRFVTPSGVRNMMRRTPGERDWVIIGDSNFDEIFGAVVWNGRAWLVGVPAPGSNSRLRSFDGTSWFDHPGGPDFALYAIALWHPPGSQAESLFVGGQSSPFDSFQGAGRFDGVSWSTIGGFFQHSVQGVIRCIAPYKSGAWDVLAFGGLFTSAGGVAAANVVGYTGAGFIPLGSGLPISSGWVSTLRQWDRADGSVLLAGGFGINLVGSIFRFNGTTWSGFGEILAQVPGSLIVTEINSIEIWRGLPAIGGRFTQRIITPISRDLLRIATIDAEDAIGPIGGGFDDTVFRIATWQGARLAFGAFRAGGGRAARWTGVAWQQLGSGLPGPAHACAIVNDIPYAAGAFGTLQKFAPDWHDVGAFNGNVHDMASVGNTIAIVGDFTVAGGTNAIGAVLAEIGDVSIIWTRLANGLVRGNNEIPVGRAVLMIGDDVLITGLFDGAEQPNGTFVASPNFVIYNLPTNQYRAPAQGGLNGEGHGLAYNPATGRVAIVGAFSTAGGASSPFVVEYDLSADTYHFAGGGFVMNLATCCAYRNGVLHVGCRDGVSWFVRRWTGFNWQNVVQPSGESVFNADILCMLARGAELDVGGRFTGTGGGGQTRVPELFITRMELDGTCRHVLGGVDNYPSFNAAFSSGGFEVLRIHVTDADELILLGAFRGASRGYSYHATRLTTRGYRALGVGLLLSSGSSNCWVRGWVRTPRGYLAVGVFDRFINPKNVPGIEEQGSSPNVVELINNRYWKRFSETGLGGQGEDVLEHGGEYFAVGWMPHHCVKLDLENETITPVDPSLESGGLAWGGHSFGGTLRICGTLKPSGFESTFPVLRLSEGVFVPENVPNMIEARQIITADLGDGPAPWLCGVTNPMFPPIENNSVLRKRFNGAWIDIIGETTRLEGEPYGMAFCRWGDTRYIAICGPMGLNGEGCFVALYDGHEFIKIVGDIGLSFQVNRIYFSPSRGGKLIAVGDWDKIEGVRAMNIAEWDPDNHWQALPYGGINSIGVSIGR